MIISIFDLIKSYGVRNFLLWKFKCPKCSRVQSFDLLLNDKMDVFDSEDFDPKNVSAKKMMSQCLGCGYIVRKDETDTCLEIENGELLPIFGTMDRVK
jgi:hypothetical protein